jgi:hypothetical protein
MPFEIIMPELTIENNVTTDMIERIRCYRFKQILKLEIGIANEHSDYIIEELFILFASYSFKAKHDSFDRWIQIFILIYTSLRVNLKSMIRHSERLTKNNFTCQSYYFPPINLLFIGESENR